MEKEKRKSDSFFKTHGECLRLNPERRVCPYFDSESISLYPIADRKQMGLRVVDNFCEEHIM